MFNLKIRVSMMISILLANLNELAIFLSLSETFEVRMRTVLWLPRGSPSKQIKMFEFALNWTKNRSDAFKECLIHSKLSNPKQAKV